MDEREADFLTRFLVESDAIEGIRNDPDEVRQHFERGAPRGPGVPIGHPGALLFLRSMTVPISESLVQRVQRLIVDAQHLKGQRKLHPAEKGAWRTFNVRMRTSDDITRPPRLIGSRWEAVPRDMAIWIAAARLLEEDRDRTPREHITGIASLHWLYERIHPFADGNGRSGRALVYYLYRRMGLVPFVFTADARHRSYYPCFERSTPELMQRYFLDRSADARAAS